MKNSRKGFKSNKIRTGIVFADGHSPHEDKKAVSVLKQVIADTQPDILIDLGDMGDFPSVNHWIPAGHRLKEGQRLGEDIKRMFKLSNEIVACVDNQEAELVKFIGNHENWIQRFIDLNPMLGGLDELNIVKHYEKLGWKVVPFGGFHTEGKLAFHHGDRVGYQGKYHASQWALMGRSIVYAHRHDVQRFTHETLKDGGKPDRHAAFSIGCLCKLDLTYMHNRKMTWNQGFGLFYINEQGMFQFNHIDIINGKAIWGGKQYDVSKNYSLPGVRH